jgi:hypothetical protein
MTRKTSKIFGYCICARSFRGYGNNASPVKEEGECCSACNERVVIQARSEALANWVRAQHAGGA